MDAVDASGSADDKAWAALPAQIDQLVKQGQYKTALRLAQDLVAWSQNRFREKSTESAQQLIVLADVYRVSGQLIDAELRYKQAVEILSERLGEDDAIISTGLNGWAVCLIEMGDYAAAEPLLRRAMIIDSKSVDEDSDYHSQTLSNLGMLKFYDGKYAEAEPLLRRTLDMRRRTHGEDDLSVADSLNQLAALYQAIKHTRKAEKLFKQALHIRRNHGDPLDVAQSLNNLALCYREANRNAEAEPLYQEALNIYRTQQEEHPLRFARGLSNLAGVYFDLGDYGRAEPLVSQALAIRRTLGDQAWALGPVVNNLATIYHATGRYEAAERLYIEAIAARRRIVGDRHPRMRTALSNLAHMYIAMDRPTDALTLMREVIAIDDRLIANVFPIASENQRLAYVASLQWNLEGILSLICRYFHNSSSVVSEGLDIVLRRKGVVAESMAARRDDLLSGRYPMLEPKMREWRSLRMKLAEETLAGPGRDGVETHRKRLEQLEDDADRLEAELASEMPEMSLEHRLRAADRQHVAQAMTEGSVLVEFVRFAVRDSGGASRSEGSTHYAAFVMEAGRADEVRIVDLGETKPIDDLVLEFREAISTAPTWFTRFMAHVGVRSHHDQGEALRSRIFDPLGLGPGNDRRIFVSPEGTLAWIPFEALPTGSGHLIDHYRISYLSVGRDLLRLGYASPVPAGDAVVVADPNFDLGSSDKTELAATGFPRETQSRDIRSARIHFQRIPATRTEGQQVSQMLGVRPLLWDAAVEGQLKGLRSPRVLHLATHGFFLPNQPDPGVERRTPSGIEWSAEEGARLTGPGMENPLLRSGLALSGANTWLAHRSLPAVAEDGILNSVDVSGLELAGTDLAVLSACETALGTAHVWEGVFGLRRAFTLAGARTLVMSLWKVADRQTTELILDFYQRLLAGEPRAEALRDAQLALKNRYSSPYYWSAFICQGDAGPLRQTQS
jgi:CHAT domain-containing protein/tetratricopeptide (TPR) repeat protein